MPGTSSSRSARDRRGRTAGLGEGELTLRSFTANPEHLQALDRVRTWTRERFKLPDEATVLVSELACALPGCPPLETVVAFWTEADRRHHFRLFKPVREVVYDDLPYAWLKDALLTPQDFDCECC
jgi:nitrate reductase delta subunit